MSLLCFEVTLQGLFLDRQKICGQPAVLLPYQKPSQELPLQPALATEATEPGAIGIDRGAVLLVSVQGISVNVDPVFCTWLLYQPHRGSSMQQAPGLVPLAKRREDEVTLGSAPPPELPPNQASDYASSPVKTKTVT
ncbi:Vacuolar protein sorting-associated protein 13B, partial [Dissostichus eleginoides]